MNRPAILIRSRTRAFPGACIIASVHRLHLVELSLGDKHTARRRHAVLFIAGYGAGDPVRFYWLETCMMQLIKRLGIEECRVDAWEFFEDDGGCWRWRHIGRTPQRDSQSARGFVSRNDCIADAMRHGYLADRTVVRVRPHFVPHH